MGRLTLSCCPAVPPFPCNLLPSVFFFLILFSSCTTIYKPPPQRPLSDREVTTIISRIIEQDDEVSSFYTYGTLLVKNWTWRSESNILTASTKNPFKIKIEIAHPWGQPILHILISKTKLKVLSFPDNKLYLGSSGSKALSRFFPGDFNADLIWAVLRGYPNLPRYHKALSLKTNQISLLDEKEKEVEVMGFYPESHLPKFTIFPEQRIRLAFSDFQENEGIFYAREVSARNVDGKKNLILKTKKMVFNRPIPMEIFTLKKPPRFETYHLNEKPNGTGQ